MSNQDKLHANWNKYKSKVKHRWEKLTDEDLHEIQGKAEVLIEKLTERYDITKSEAKERLHTFLENVSDSAESSFKKLTKKITHMVKNVTHKSQQAAKRGTDYAKKNPAATLGVVFAVGALVGLLFPRKKK